MEKRSDFRAILNNSAWLIGESVVTMLISLIVGVISARYLGPNNYGVINRFLPYITLANSISTFGMQSIIVREISKNNSKDNISKILGSAIVFRTVLAIILIVLVNCYAFYVSLKEGRLIFIVSTLQSIVLLFNSYEIITYYFHAELKSKYLAISITVTSILVGIWKIILLLTKANVIYFAFSTTLQAIFMLIFCTIFFKKIFCKRLSFSKKTLKILINDSYHLLLTSLGIVIYSQVDKIMIGNQLGNIQLGYYSAAYTIATMWYFLPQALANSFRSKIFESVNNIEEYNKLSRVLFMFITIIGIIAGVGLSILREVLIKILYGVEYIEASSTLLILGWIGLFANLGTSKSIWLVGRKLHQYTKWYTIMGASLNIVLNYILIPKWGINGAAFATVISQFFVQFIFPIFFKNTREVVLHMVYCFSSIRDIKGYIEKYYILRGK